MADLISKFMLMKTCEVTKHIAVGRKSQNMFLRIGTEHVSSMSNIVTVGLPKRINYLRVWQVISEIQLFQND